MKLPLVLRLVTVAALLLGATFVLLNLGAVKEQIFQFLEWVRGMGIWGRVLLGAAYIPACLLFIPGSLLTIGAGVIFDLVEGTITVSLGSVAGAACAFLMGRTLARDWISRKVAGNLRFQALDEAVQKNGFKIVLLTRLSPIIPFNFLNYMFGVTRVSLGDYVLASWIGMLPGTIMYVYLGSTLTRVADLASGKIKGGLAQQLLFVFGLLATVAVTVLVTRLARRALREAVPIESTMSATRTPGAP